MKIIICISLIFFNSLASYCQSIGINEDASAPNPSALVDIKSISRGLLIPHMSTAQRKALTGITLSDTYSIFLNYSSP